MFQPISIPFWQTLKGIKSFMLNKTLCTHHLLFPRCIPVYISIHRFLFQKDSMERLVLAPLSSLQGMFAAPQKLIQKRYDKLLDYCSRLERSSSFTPSSTTSSSTSLVSEDRGRARRDYEALNALLVEELQRFNMAARTILTNCVVYTVALLRGLMDSILNRAPSIQQLPVRILHIKYMIKATRAQVTKKSTKISDVFASLGSIIKHD